ncbi:MAG: cysteine--tRNA ligase [Desulfobacterales bacterium]|nr:cysteine--tRNA ligase [Desulfobacterales bacterium]MBF0396968.1 cysteine--tRNA ligase [Desulfobacterales bacterium]
MSNSILDAIGNTPLVEIKKLNPNHNVKIMAKLEYFNPAGSIKDRPALYMIESGEKTGALTRDKVVIEATSGNTGIGLALVCAIKGYRLLLTMSEFVSLERQKILKARGAEIMLTPGHLGTDGAIEKVYDLVRENPNKYFMTDQFNNPANWQAHYFGTAEEILRQTNGQLSILVSTMGTTGTVMGLSRKLKEFNSNIKIIGVEPYLGHKIQGLKNMKEAYRPELYEKNRLDEKINIDDEEAYDMSRKLARDEGIFVGMSSGAAMVIARKKAETLKEGMIVVIFPDGGERYLSTPLFAVQEEIGTKFYNTMTRSKEHFKPLVSGKVGMYSCGPTPSKRMHLGECRRFIFADTVHRYLEYKGYDVKHIMNITDIDDKTIKGSEEANISLSEFTDNYIKFFMEDLKTLGVKEASSYHKVSEHLYDMVDVSKKLIQKGFAYEKLRSIYFDISRVSNYGKLSSIDINKIKVGATVDLDEYEKDNPRDFTLLRRSKLSELKKGIYIKSEWGSVRPSWHLQCATISMKHLGETFDIHTSSRDLVFPHHENELAIAYGLTGKPLAKYWMHCEQVNVSDNELKEANMPISLNSLISMGYSGREIRYLLISNHYRKPINLSIKGLESVRHALKRFDSCIYSLIHLKEGTLYPELDQILYDLKQGFTGAMDDDLNVSEAIATIFNIVKRVNILVSDKKISPDQCIKILDILKNINSVLNLFDFGEGYLDKEIEILIEGRKKARIEKNWELADKIREELISKNVILRDEKI